MDYIPVDTSALHTVVLSLLGAVAAGFLIIVVRHIIKNRSKSDPIVVTFVGIPSIFLLFLVIVGLSGDEGLNPGGLSRQDDAVRAEIQSSYGIELNDEEFKALQYPHREPSEGYRNFGSESVVIPDGSGDYTKVELALLWDDGKMVLVGDDGKELTPLDSKN